LNQSAIIERLATGEAFGGAPPERIDTHVSVVFLTANRAYKLKRALTTPYLDYGTLEQRQRCCEAEIAINRRTAPQIYRQATAVTREADGRLALDGTGPAVEWLVEMARFDTQQGFDRLAAAGRLDEALMRRLADEIADFHGAAESVATDDGRGRVAPLITTNDGELRRFLGAPFEAAPIAALAQQQHARLAQVGALLDSRARAGRIRHCHGDLHLRNIALIDGRPTLFDAIEFSEDFSHIDVLYDLAFLLMDLLHGGHRGLANLAMNRYLLQSAELPGLACLPLFLSLRAAIRAHVTARAAGQQTSETEAARLRDEAAEYLALAGELLEPPRPCVIALGGFSGTGKSTLARRLAPALHPAPGAVIVSSDPLRKRLLGVAPEERLGPQAYVAEVDARVFDTLFAEAEATLAAGFPVVLDMTFRAADLRARAEALARSLRVPFAGFWLQAAPETLAQRIEQRRDDASDATVSVLAGQLAAGAESVEWPRIDTSHSLPDSHDRVAAAVAAICAARDVPQ